MKKFLLILSIISAAAISCANKDNAGGATESTVSKNIPSLLKSKKDGTPNTQQSLALSVSAQPNQGGTTSDTTITTNDITDTTTPETGTYNLLQRLYDTAWVSEKKDWDNGIPETEETYIFFNENSEMVEREYENGVLDGKDDYSTLEWIKDIQVPANSGNIGNTQMPLPSQNSDYSRNACIVKNMEKGDYDTDYEIYFMTGKGDDRVLYVVDGDNETYVLNEFKKLLVQIAKGTVDSDNRYVLAKQAK